MAMTDKKIIWLTKNTDFFLPIDKRPE